MLPDFLKVLVKFQDSFFYIELFCIFANGSGRNLKKLV